MHNFIPYYSIVFIILLSFIIGFYKNQNKNHEDYFIGSRNSNWILIAFSIAATFFYANVPFFILKWQPVYGVVGGLWVTFGIIIPIILLGFLGYFISKKKNFKKFFNITDLIIEKSKNKTLILLFIFIYVMAAVYNLSANLTAFGFVTEYFSSVNYSLLTALFLLAIVIYTIIGGFNTVIKTDLIQMILILLGGFGVGYFVTQSTGNVSDIVIKQFGNFLDMNLVLNVGLTMLIIICGSAITDNGLFQRMFTLKNGKKILKSFSLGALIYFVSCFGIILLYCGWLNTDIKSDTAILSVLDTINTHGNQILMFFFVTAILSMSASNIDSVMHGVSSMLSKYFSTKNNQKKIANIILIIFVILVYVITQMKIDLWLLLTTFGTVRLSVVFPTLYIIFYNNINVKAIIIGILTSLSVGLYLQSTDLNKLYTILITLLIPLIIIKSFELKSKLIYNKE